MRRMANRDKPAWDVHTTAHLPMFVAGDHGRSRAVDGGRPQLRALSDRGLAGVRKQYVAHDGGGAEREDYRAEPDAQEAD